MAVGAAAASSKSSSDSTSAYNAGYSAGAANASTANANAAAANANAAAANANVAAGNANAAAANASVAAGAAHGTYQMGAVYGALPAGCISPQSLGRWNLLFVRQHLVQSVLWCERDNVPRGTHSVGERASFEWYGFHALCRLRKGESNELEQ